MCRPVAKSGQSICRVTSAAAIEATSASNTSREVVKMIGLHDSLLEEAGFEPSVPRKCDDGFETAFLAGGAETSSRRSEAK